jgi:hypothetical protein
MEYTTVDWVEFQLPARLIRLPRGALSMWINIHDPRTIVMYKRAWSNFYMSNQTAYTTVSEFRIDI